MKYLIAVVEGALPTAVVLALLIAYLRLPGTGIGRQMRRWPAWCAVAGLLGAVVLVVLRSTTVLVNREYVNLVLATVALALEVLLLLGVWLYGDATRGAGGRGGWAGTVRAGVPALLAGVLVLSALADVLLLPSSFVTAGESVLNTAVLLRAGGYVIGLLLVSLTGLAVYRTSVEASPRMLRIVLTAALALTALGQLVLAAQILLVRGLIPMDPVAFTVVAWVINHEHAVLFGLLIITLLLPLAAWRRSRLAPSGYANPAELRLQRAHALSRRRFCTMVLAGYALSTATVTVIKTYDEQEPVLSPAEPVDQADGTVSIPVERVSDGHLHRFAYPAKDGIEVRFIVVKRNEAAFGVGLDACTTCGATGYFERAGKVICKLCDVAINIPTIGFKGGCNPIPVPYSLSHGRLLLEAKALEAHAEVFA
ncbi:Fe-S-containing protein [Nonomuraea basaltis]|uniref:Fe-S-containing protein n=1 Tax=Nonomuraea basaltis TaxID=2495887 RepID=UPI00110C44BE|nr:Fe-S-containing protein [Nonomuraea basaltis]TMR96829.1 DUF2318 domain-containing protein [Nonomuraea basaltis]